MPRGALLPCAAACAAGAAGAPLACTCGSDYPYCYATGAGHDNYCYKGATSNQYSKTECAGTCTSSYTPPPAPPTPPAPPAPPSGRWTSVCRRWSDSRVVSSMSYYYDKGSIQINRDHSDPQPRLDDCWCGWDQRGMQNGCTQDFPAVTCQFEIDGRPQWQPSHALFLAVGVQQPPQAYTRLGHTMLLNLTDLLSTGAQPRDRWLFVIPGSVWGSARSTMCGDDHRNATKHPRKWRLAERDSMVNATLHVINNAPSVTGYVLAGTSAGAVAVIEAMGSERLYKGTERDNATGARMIGAVLFNAAANSVVTEDHTTQSTGSAFDAGMWGRAKILALRDNASLTTVCSANDGFVYCNGANDYLRHWHGRTGLETMPNASKAPAAWAQCQDQTDWLHCWRAFIKGKVPRPPVTGYWNHNIPENCHRWDDDRRGFDASLARAIREESTETDGCTYRGCGVAHLQTKWMSGDGRGCQSAVNMNDGLGVSGPFAFPVCGGPLHAASCDRRTGNCDSCVWKGCFGLGIDPGDDGPVCNNKTHLCEPNETHWACPYPRIRSGGECQLDSAACPDERSNCKVCDDDAGCALPSASSAGAPPRICLLPNTSWVQSHPAPAELNKVFKCQECSVDHGWPGYPAEDYPGQIGPCGKDLLQFAPTCARDYTCRGCGPKALSGRSMACVNSTDVPVCLNETARCGCTDDLHCRASHSPNWDDRNRRYPALPYCNASRQECVRCGTSGWQCDDTSAAPVCHDDTGRCGCRADWECVNSTTGGMCDTTVRECKRCGAGFTCDANSTRPACDAGTGLCGCGDDADCAVFGGACNTTSRRCVRPPPVCARVSKGHGCAAQTVNLGGGLSTPEACAVRAETNGKCIGYFMYSPHNWDDWGCRCCDSSRVGDSNVNWEMWEYSR